MSKYRGVTCDGCGCMICIEDNGKSHPTPDWDGIYDWLCGRCLHLIAHLCDVKEPADWEGKNTNDSE